MENMETIKEKVPAKLEVKEETLSQGKRFTPRSDIFETDREISILMDMPGVVKDDVSINLEKNILEISGEITTKGINQLSPLYTEYNVGNFYRSFTLGEKIAKDQIDAQLTNGVLTLKLPKIPEAQPRRIAIR